jgi:tRNA(Ile)-lysidine synthase
VLPYLADRLGSGIASVLAREADIFRQDEEFLTGATTDAARRVVSRESEHRVIHVPELLSTPPALARRIVHGELIDASHGRFIGYDHVLAFLEFAAGSDSATDFPGVRVERKGDKAVLTHKGNRGAVQQPFSYPLYVPGTVELPEAGCAISAETLVIAAGDAWKETIVGRERDLAVVEAGSLPARLTVRSRHPGDCFQPLGLDGQKKLQDFFVDRKVARAERDRIPLVCDHRNHIIWVAGHALADEFRVTARTRAVVILRRTELGGAD